MPTQRFVSTFRYPYLLILVILFITSSCTYQNEEFKFTAPFGFKTKQFETPTANLDNESELLIFSQKGHLYFQIFRHRIPEDSDLETVFTTYYAISKESSSHYQFISQNNIEIKDHLAIEYIFREFHGEPYIQVREIWMEHNHWAYSLICTNPADSTPGLDIPIHESCFQLVDNFEFK